MQRWLPQNTLGKLSTMNDRPSIRVPLSVVGRGGEWFDGSDQTTLLLLHCQIQLKIIVSESSQEHRVQNNQTPWTLNTFGNSTFKCSMSFLCCLRAFDISSSSGVRGTPKQARDTIWTHKLMVNPFTSHSLSPPSSLSLSLSPSALTLFIRLSMFCILSLASSAASLAPRSSLSTLLMCNSSSVFLFLTAFRVSCDWTTLYS